MPAALTFFVSLFVSILCIPFSIYQARRLGEALPLPEPEGGRSVLDDPEIPVSYAAQSLEVAYGFPAMILTVIAFEDLFGWSAWTGVVSVVLVLAFAGFLAVLTHPHRIGLFLRLRIGPISLVSAAIVVANMVGLVLAFVLPHEG